LSKLPVGTTGAAPESKLALAAAGLPVLGLFSAGFDCGQMPPALAVLVGAAAGSLIGCGLGRAATASAGIGLTAGLAAGFADACSVCAGAVSEPRKPNMLLTRLNIEGEDFWPLSASFDGMAAGSADAVRIGARTG
jgi:hypothetical protein